MLGRANLHTVLVFVFAVLSGGALFYTSQSVQRAESKLQDMRHTVSVEQEAIRVLRAEWAYLNNPARLENLAAEYLDMHPPGAGRIAGEASFLPDTVLLEDRAGGFEDAEFAPPESEDRGPADIFVDLPEEQVRKDSDMKNINTLLNELEAAGGAP